ncbi:MAG: hypothetical protein ACREVP_03055 [Burkholderiales bacterium]
MAREPGLHRLPVDRPHSLAQRPPRRGDHAVSAAAILRAGLAESVLPDKSAEIVVYCASSTCQNSHIAARRLEQAGYANVSV